MIKEVAECLETKDKVLQTIHPSNLHITVKIEIWNKEITKTFLS